MCASLAALASADAIGQLRYESRHTFRYTVNDASSSAAARSGGLRCVGVATGGSYTSRRLVLGGDLWTTPCLASLSSEALLASSRRSAAVERGERGMCGARRTEGGRTSPSTVAAAAVAASA